VISVSSWSNSKTTKSICKPKNILSRNDGRDRPVLYVGNKLSYGDSCLNDKGYLLDNRFNDCILDFNPQKKVIKVQTGITFSQLLKFLVPKGYFVPVTPGTKEVTLGGAVANDVHGKNHHADASFGNWIISFQLQRSGRKTICSLDKNSDLFLATIGGLGLTGYIEWVEFSVIPIKSSSIDTERIKFSSINEFLDIVNVSENYKYSIAWLQGKSFFSKANAFKGVFLRGNHSLDGKLVKHKLEKKWNALYLKRVLTLNSYSIRLFNFLYYYIQFFKRYKSTQYYNDFFYPLDKIGNWNQLSGKMGVLQFQCVIPFESFATVAPKIFLEIHQSGHLIYLATIKTLGHHPSFGLLSFTSPGFTLAIDVLNKGEVSKRLFLDLFKIVEICNGRVYPAKDQFMTKGFFESFYPHNKEFKKFVVPGICSDWWRRVRR
jgi:FAD/FMN-containing dehydrogenase